MCLSIPWQQTYTVDIQLHSLETSGLGKGDWPASPSPKAGLGIEPLIIQPAAWSIYWQGYKRMLRRDEEDLHDLHDLHDLQWGAAAAGSYEHCEEYVK